MIDKATVRRILDAANIVEVVSDYVHLTRSGANYKGLCPFHNERTPSFSVSPSRGICHCFSCGKGGSPVNFIMEKEGINFHDALLRLADKYGIKVEERELSDEERQAHSRRESMLNLNEWAMNRFRENMNATEEGRTVGLEYFYQRGLTKQAIDKFKLGYALDKPADMYDAATRNGFEQQILFDVGLAGKGSSNKPYDRFRGRVIYPMLNAAGKVIAFGGRGIKGESAKYINSPESDIYHKSNELYGIFQAKNAIVRQRKCFLVEGYMDVIGMWQSGMENVVASSGTSLTDGQVALIHRFTDNITIMYDGDSAGIHASIRAIDICLANKMNVSLLLLPDGDDPDSFAAKHSPEEFRKYAAAHERDFIEFKADVLGKDNSPVARAEALKSMVNSIALVSDLITRTVLIQKCSSLMAISESVITAEVGRAAEKVIISHRQRRDKARLEAENKQVSANDPFIAKPSSQTSTTPSSPRMPLIYAVEKQVMEYVVRFGMLPFCESASTPDTVLNVAEYVREELMLDRLSFSEPLFQSLFNNILALIPAYREQEEVFQEKLAAKIADKREEALAHMMQKSMSMQQIEAAEQERQEQETQLADQEIRLFAAEWIGKELGSSPIDSIRKFVLSTITPRYTLSKYHSKGVHIESDEERLAELLPRAMGEWKDALLLQKRKELDQNLALAVAQNDNDAISKIMMEIQHNSELRSSIAKNLGERILIPRR